MPPKVRDLVKDLLNAGFTDRGGKGSHRNFIHPDVSKSITISGNMGDDAKHYQIHAVQSVLKEINK